MNAGPLVVLDEGCHPLAARLPPALKAFSFSRRGGFRSSCRVAVDELRGALLARGDPEKPILVAPSFAGFTALLYAHQFPGEVAALLLLDPSHPRQGSVALSALNSSAVPATPTVASFRAMFSGFGETWDEGCRAVAAITSLGDTRLVVLAADNLQMPAEIPADVRARLTRDRQVLLREYARLSSRGECRVVEGAGHAIAVDAPEVVVQAIQKLATEVDRDGGGARS